MDGEILNEFHSTTHCFTLSVHQVEGPVLIFMGEVVMVEDGLGEVADKFEICWKSELSACFLRSSRQAEMLAACRI